MAISRFIICFLSICLLSNVWADTHNYQALVDKAYNDFKDLKEGKNADYIPILAKVPSDLFGVVIATADGKIYHAGDVEHVFSIQSVSKPFTAALVMNENSPAFLQEKIGVEATGLPFNSKIALELIPARSVNPLVNAGAIASVSLVKADGQSQRWKKVQKNLNAFAGRTLPFMKDVYTSEYSTAWSNRAIANLLYNYERLYADPEESLVVYTKQCSVGVTAKDLAVMGATLANQGVNPITNKTVMKAEYIDEVLSVMMTAGFYDESGEWSMRAGLPAKTGVGGGIVAVVPGKLAIVGFSPRLNKAGNSIRAMRAIEQIAQSLQASIFLPH